MQGRGRHYARYPRNNHGKRKYTFYDRYQKVKYANITAEELEVLNISYNKEHYNKRTL